MKIINFTLGLVGTVCLSLILFIWFLGGILFCDSPQFCDDHTISLAWGTIICGILALAGQIYLLIQKVRWVRIDSLVFIYGLLYLFFQHNFPMFLQKENPMRGFSIFLLIGELLILVFVIGVLLLQLHKKDLSAHATNANPKEKKLSISNQITPLLNSIISGDLALVQTALTDHPEQLNTAYAQNGNTPLHVAALNGYTDIVRLLLEQPGIDTTRTNNEGKTALDLAREKGHSEISQLLENK